MTLTKIVEAARNILDGRNLGRTIHGWYELSQALATLPDKPMTEDELVVICRRGADQHWLEDAVFRKAISALKAANVLYVEEK